MVQQNIDFIGGGFKLTFPYTFVGWVLWALGLVLTGIGIVAATNALVTSHAAACPACTAASCRVADAAIADIAAVRVSIARVDCRQGSGCHSGC